MGRKQTKYVFIITLYGCGVLQAQDNYKQAAFNYLNDLLKLHSAVINIAMDSCDNRFKGKL